MARPKRPHVTPSTPTSDGAPGRRALTYVRVSHGDGLTKRGLEDQRTACAAYLLARGYHHLGEGCDDGVSGAVRWSERAGLHMVVERCMAGAADVIVAYHQDRFARKAGVFDDLRDVALLRGFRLETAVDARVLTRPEDFTTGDVLALVAAIERRRISERFQAARRRRSQVDGRGSGPLPWGYVAGPEGILLVEERAAATIRALFALRRRHTYQATVETLNAQGHAAPRGGRWTVGQVETVEQHRELYRTGVRRWGGITATQRWPLILPTRAGGGG